MKHINRPFSETLLATVIVKKETELRQEIDSLSDSQLVSNSKDYLVAYFVEKYSLIGLVIHEEDRTLRQQERCKIKKYQNEPFFRQMYGRDYSIVDGVRVKFYFPFSGPANLFNCRANSYSLSGYPPIELEDGYLVLKCERQIYTNAEAPDASDIIKEIQEQRSSLCTGASYLNRDIATYNQKLETSIESLLQDRLELARKLTSLLSDLEIPVERKVSQDGQICLSRRTLKLENNSKRSEPNCYINDTAYLEIIDLIKHCYATCERTPATYKSLDEEALRDLALVPLNSQYKGSAVGEAFRNKGKTDICIEANNRAAFVAECKIWKGPKQLKAAVIQLLGYLTWRDSKTALIIFSRNKDFRSVLASAANALCADARCKSFNMVEENEFECKFVSEMKPGDITIIRVLLFDLYAE